MPGRDDIRTELTEGAPRRNILLMLLIYTGLFICAAAAAYFMFISQGRTFLRFWFMNKDSFSQRYMFLFEFRRFIENLFAGGTVNTWDWSIGLGADAYSFNISNLVNPFSYIAAFAPYQYVDTVYSLTIAARVYFSGAAFVLFARKTGLTDLQNILGAMLYAFSPWLIINSVAQGTFLMATIMLPLVLLGAEKILKSESPLLFVFTVAYSVIVTFSFAYIIGIITVMYFFVRYFTEYRGNGTGAFLKSAGTLFGFGSLGILVSGIGLVVTMLKFGNSTATTGKEIPALFTATQYLRIPLKLLDYSTVFENSSVIGISALGLVMIPVIAVCFFRLRTNAVMTVILLALSLIPYTSSVFNFFSYTSGRWYFVIAFFYSLATAEAFDDRYLKNGKIRAAIAMMFVVYSGYLLWIQKILKPTGRLMVMINWMTALIILAVILFAYRKNGEKIMANRRMKLAVTSVLAVVLAAGTVTVYNLRFFREGEGYLEAGAANGLIRSSVQRIGAEIDDDGFYRVDQVGDLLGINDPHCKVNEAIYYGNRSNYVFCSSVDNDWLTYNKLLGNSQGYYKRVAPNSNDDRFGLEVLQGVKYFIGDDIGGGAEKDTTPYAAYGFGDQVLIDGVELMTNKYDIGIGCLFDLYMRESEWLTLSYADREIAMLKAVIIPDSQKAPAGLKELKAADLKSGVTEAEYEVVKRNRKGNKFVISAENDDKHLLIMTFKNVRTTVNGRLTIRVNNRSVRKTAINTLNDARGFSDIRDLTFNLGSGEDAAREVSVHLIPNGKGKKKAKVKFDDLIIYKVPLRTYDKAAGKLEKGKLELTSFENDRISGTIRCEKPEVLYLSVPDDDGWEVKVDGKKVKKRNSVDYAFTGVDLTAGQHTVDLEYHTRGFIAGAALTLAGLVITVIALIIRAIRKRSEDNSQKQDI